jgi:hypothetical protein
MPGVYQISKSLDKRDDVNTLKAERIKHDGEHYAPLRGLLDKRVGASRG